MKAVGNYDSVTDFNAAKGMIDQAIEYINYIRNNNIYDKLGKNGRELIKQKYSWEAITRKIILIYKRILSEQN